MTLHAHALVLAGYVLGAHNEVPPRIQAAIDAIMAPQILTPEPAPRSVDDLMAATAVALTEHSQAAPACEPSFKLTPVPPAAPPSPAQPEPSLDLAAITRQLTDIELSKTVPLTSATTEPPAKKTRKPWTPERRAAQAAMIAARNKRNSKPKLAEKITPLPAPPPPPKKETPSPF